MAAIPVDRMRVVEGDITKQDVDAVVNAANESLLGGGGVDGAIHRAAGPGLLEECKGLDGCPTGEARLTGGHNLPARWVVHTVGPVWRGGSSNEDQLLENAYRNSMRTAREAGARSVAFPAISTGAYGFPPDRAARIAARVVGGELAEHDGPEEVVFVCFDGESARHHREALESLKG
mgnify:CR=1 FL=1